MTYSWHQKQRKAFYMTIPSLGLLMLTLTSCGNPEQPPGAKPSVSTSAGSAVVLPPGAPIPLSQSTALNPKPLSANVLIKSSSLTAEKSPLTAGTPIIKKTLPDTEEGLAESILGSAVKSPVNTNDSSNSNPLTSTLRVEQAGLTVNLASEVIAVEANPFLDKLPKPVVIAVPTSENLTGANIAAALPPPENPFDAVSLLGIAYSKTTPMALVSLGGESTQSQLVRQGETLNLDGGTVRVIKITQDSVDLQRLDSSHEKRNFSMPSIIGYSAVTSKSASAESLAPQKSGTAPSGVPAELTNAAVPVPPNLSAVPSPPRSSGTMPELSNLKQLLKNSSAATTGKTSLREP